MTNRYADTHDGVTGWVRCGSRGLYHGHHDSPPGAGDYAFPAATHAGNLQISSLGVAENTRNRCRLSSKSAAPGWDSMACPRRLSPGATFVTRGLSAHSWRGDGDSEELVRAETVQHLLS